MAHLHIGVHLMRTRPRSMRPVRQSVHAAGGIPAQPPMQALPAHPYLLGHLGDRQAVLTHCKDRLVTLLNHWHLLEHHAHSFRLSHQPRIETEQGVKDQPRR